MHRMSHGSCRATALMLGVATGIAGGVSAAGAQAPVDRPPIPAFSAVYVQGGTLQMNVSQLNPHLERLDLPAGSRPGYFTLSNDAYAIGVGAYGVVVNRVGLGLEWTSADAGSESSPTGKSSQLTTSYLMGTIGFAAFTTWHLNVLPFIGIGRGSATLTLRDRAGGAGIPGSSGPTFDDVVLAPGAQSSMSARYVIVQPALAVDYLVLRDNRSTVGVTLGVRLSKAISPNRATWTYAGQTVFGGPDVGPSGTAIRFVVGIGGFRLVK